MTHFKKLGIDSFKQLKIRLIVGTFIVSSVFYNTLQAQDVLYSQFLYSPMQTNPAMIATSNQILGVFNYRQQFIGNTQTFTTPSLSITAPIINRGISKRLASVGLSFMNDVGGDNGLLKTTGIQGAFALNIPLELPLGLPILYDSYLSLAVQGGYFQRGLDVNSVTTGSQFVNGFLDRSIPTGEAFGNQEIFSFPTLNLGAFWYSQDVDGITRAYIGFSVSNLNRPNVSIATLTPDRLPMAYSFLAGIDAYKSANEKFFIQPNLRWVNRGTSTQINIGANFRYQMYYTDYQSDDVERGFIKGAGLIASAWYSTTNGVVASVGIDHPNYQLLFGYDMGSLSLNNAQSRAGALELTLGVKFGKVKLPKREADIYDYEEDIPDFDRLYQSMDTLTENNLEEADKQGVASNQEPAKPPKNMDLLTQKVYFISSADSLTQEAKAALDEIADLMSNYEEIKVEIEGHACNLFVDEQKNNLLSLRRAVNVKDYLISKGVKPAQLQTSGYGSLRPVTEGEEENARIPNRRVEFLVLKQ